MSVMWLREWTTEDFFAYCDKLEDKNEAFLLKEYVSKQVNRLQNRLSRAEQELSDQRWVRDQRLGYVQGSN